MGQGEMVGERLDKYRARRLVEHMEGIPFHTYGSGWVAINKQPRLG